MLISLHKQATTSPKIRAAIQASSEPAWLVAERYGISEQTVWKWRGRDGVQDRSHTPHRLQTTLTPHQEAVAVALRKALLLPLDDLLAVVREFQSAGLALGARSLPAAPWGGQPAGAEAERGQARARQLQGLRARLPAHRHQVSAADGRRGPPPLPLRGHRPGDKMGLRAHLSGADRGQRAEVSPRSRTCRPDEDHPPAERFNGRIEDVLQSHRFHSGEDLEQTLLRYVHLYNSQLPQSALKGRTPIAALKDWQRQRPELFKKRVYNHAGCDT